MSMPRDLQIRGEFQCVFQNNSRVNFGSFSMQNRDILGYQKPSARCCETRGQNWSKMRVASATSLIRLGAFSSKNRYGLGCLNWAFFRDHLGVYKNRFGRHFWRQNGVPRPFSRACFSGFQLRDTIIEQSAPFPCENNVFGMGLGKGARPSAC